MSCQQLLLLLLVPDIGYVKLYTVVDSGGILYAARRVAYGPKEEESVGAAAACWYARLKKGHKSCACCCFYVMSAKKGQQ